MFTLSNGRRRVGMMAAAAVLAAGSTAGAGTVEFLLRDHPSTGAGSTSHGLRMDNIFTTIGGTGGETYFSMSHFGDTILTVDTNGSTLSINITGTLYGGVANGASYGFGEGAYRFEMNYTMNVQPLDDGWITTLPSPVNTGVLRALGDNNGVPSGTEFEFADKGDGLPSFVFLRDGFLLTPEQQMNLGNPWVARGWFMMDGVQSGAQDMLAVGEFVPLPSASLMAGVGVLGVAGRRRRRA